jgi:hypothetical protein
MSSIGPGGALGGPGELSFKFGRGAMLGALAPTRGPLRKRLEILCWLEIFC